MQFSTIIATVAFAMAAVAAPAENLVERTTPAQTAANQCSINQKLSCCKQIIKAGKIPFINVQLGLTCTTVDVLSVLPLNSICSPPAGLACCNQGSTSQTGTVNVAVPVQVCPVVVV